MEYLWTKGRGAARFPALEGDLRTGVLVIGGGMAGASLRQLRDRGVDCVLAGGEPHRHGHHQGHHRRAFRPARRPLFRPDPPQRRGPGKTLSGGKSPGCGGVPGTSRTIPCDFQDMPSVMYSQTERDVLEQEARAVRSLGFPAEFLTSGAPFPFRVAGAVKYLAWPSSTR